jgi:hypothetical protein
VALAVASGLLLAWAFPTHDHYWLAPVAVAVLSAAVLGSSWRFAGVLGLASGLAFFLPTLSWSGIYVGVLPWVALCVLQALYVGAMTAATAAVQRPLLASRLRPLAYAAVPVFWVLQETREIAARPGLYFVDSRTSGSSVAYRAARQHGVPSAERNVFLDTLRSEGAIREAFEELVIRALRDERALAIGHPYPETLKVLREELPKLARYGIRLVAPSELIARQGGARGPWRPLKLSPALTLATTPALPGLPAATSASAH